MITVRPMRVISNCTTYKIVVCERETFDIDVFDDDSVYIHDWPPSTRAQTSTKKFVEMFTDRLLKSDLALSLHDTHGTKRRSKRVRG